MAEQSPQERLRCACPPWSSPTECIRIRYGRNPTGGYDDGELEECECGCHEGDEDDDDGWLRPLVLSLFPGIGLLDVAEAAPDWFLMENVPDAPLPEVPGYATQDHLLNNRWLGEEQNRAGTVPLPCFRFDGELVALEAPGWTGAILASGGRKPGTEGRRGRTRGAWHGWTGGAAYEHALKSQGPPDFLADAPFTAKERFRVVGNGVPLPMGRAVARAVRRALGLPLQGVDQ